MNGKLFFIISVLLFFSTSLINAENGKNTPTNNSEYAYLHKDTTNNRPRIPDKNPSTILCLYGNGYLDLTLPGDVEYATIVLYDYDMPIWTGYISTENSVVNIPLLHGEYQITCTTGTNEVFIGFLYFQ